MHFLCQDASTPEQYALVMGSRSELLRRINQQASRVQNRLSMLDAATRPAKINNPPRMGLRPTKLPRLPEGAVGCCFIWGMESCSRQSLRRTLCLLRLGTCHFLFKTPSLSSSAFSFIIATATSIAILTALMAIPGSFITARASAFSNFS